MNVLKKLSVSAFLAIPLAATLALTACSPGGVDSNPDVGDKVLSIGINQLVTHPALDAVVNGFKKAFSDAGYVEGESVRFDVQNAQGDQATATAIANKFVTSNVDLVLAVGTPSVQATTQAVTKIPVIFAAVTDPVAAGIVVDPENPGENVTGVSSLQPVADQLQLISEIAPNAKTVGVVYSSGEANSEIQVALARKAAPALGLVLKEVTVSNANEVQEAVNSLGQVDALYIPADNTVVSAFDAVLQVAESKKIPVITADTASVDAGGIATYGFDYSKIGEQAGEMAIRVLKEKKNPADMPVESAKVLSLVVNPEAAQRMGVALSEGFIASADRVVK